MERIVPRLTLPIPLADNEFRCLVDFVRNGLLDKRAQPDHFRKLVPESLPSGRTPLIFEFNDEAGRGDLNGSIELEAVGSRILAQTTPSRRIERWKQKTEKQKS